MPTPNEALTRRDLIDPALTLAGWDVANENQVGIEIPVDGSDPAAWATLAPKLHAIREAGGQYEAELPSGIADYLLYDVTGQVLAVVERIQYGQTEPNLDLDLIRRIRLSLRKPRTAATVVESDGSE